MIRTSCQDCIFRINEFGKQTGCSFYNRLQKFLEEDKAIFVEEDGHYIINRFCSACRNNNGQDINIDIARELVNQQIQYKQDYVIRITDNTPNNVLTKELLTKLNAHTFIFCVNSKFANIGSYWQLINDELQGKDSKFLIKRSMLDVTLSKEDCANLAINNTRSAYYSVIDIEDKVPDDMHHKMNVIINHDLLQPILVKENEFYPNVINTKIHKHLHGNETEASLIDKIMYLATQDNNNYNHILDWNDFT